MRRYNWKKILVGSLWILAGIGTIVLLGAAIQKKNRKTCADTRIEISGAEKHLFIDEKDVMEMLDAAGKPAGKPIGELNLRELETLLEKNSWVRNAEMYLDNNQVLQVRIEERQPVARVFALDGSSFYVDSGALRLPLSEKLSARVPVFTGFPSGKTVLAHPDSLLLKDIVKLGTYILADSFWMAQVAQVDIAAGSEFEMVPVVGDHIIHFGRAENAEKKFDRLYTFYKKAWLQNGINTYEKLDLQYDNQVVAIRKGAAKAWADSARAREWIKQLASTADTALAVSLPVSDLKKDSAQRKIAAAAVGKTNAKTVEQSNNKTNNKPLTKGAKSKPKKNKPSNPAAKTPPKAVMGKTNG